MIVKGANPVTRQVCTFGNAEFQVIQATLRVDAARDMALQSAVQQPLDWRHLQYLANYHGVLPFVYTRLKEVAPQMVPAEVMREMAAFQKANELRVALMTMEPAKRRTRPGG